VNTTEAVRVPAALGEKLAVSVHCADADSEEPQLFVNLKSAAAEPVTWTLERVRVVLPTFVNVTRRGELVAPTFWLANFSAVLLREKPGVGAGTTSALPPPPQDMDPTTMTEQKIATIPPIPR
jgi:hypothetical protein